MKYFIERAIANCPSDGWVRSDTFPHAYTYKQAKEILRTSTVLHYRMVPVTKTPIMPTITNEVIGDLFITAIIDAVKDSISFERVWKFLPFPTSPKSGNTYVHITNQSVYPVVTEKRTVYEGQTLCGRAGRLYTADASQAECPGCLAIARGLAVREMF